MMAGVDFSAVAGVIAGISVPVLLLSGELDQVTPSKNADAVAAILSSANCGKVEKRVVEGASHNMMVDSAELVNQVVGEFVKGVL